MLCKLLSSDRVANLLGVMARIRLIEVKRSHNVRFLPSCLRAWILAALTSTVRRFEGRKVLHFARVCVGFDLQPKLSPLCRALAQVKRLTKGIIRTFIAKFVEVTDPLLLPH